MTGRTTRASDPVEEKVLQLQRTQNLGIFQPCRQNEFAVLGRTTCFVDYGFT